MDRRAEQSYRERIRCCLSPGSCRALHWALLLHGGCVIGPRESLYSCPGGHVMCSWGPRLRAFVGPAELMLVKHFWGLSPEQSVPVWRGLAMYVLQTPCFQSSTSLHDNSLLLRIRSS